MSGENQEFFEALNEYALNELEKARGNRPDERIENLPARNKEPQTFFVNPYDFTGQTGMWRERRTSLTWDALRVMSEKNPIISSIVNTRVRQVGTFSAPVSDSEATGNDQLGYRIKHKDSQKKLSKSEEGYVKEVEQIIQCCGILPGVGNGRTGRDGFDTWLKKMVRDSLTFDAGVTELIPTKKGGLHSFYAVDAATIRMAAVQDDDNGIDDKKFVQILNGQIVAHYEPDEIMYCIRNPTTNIRNNGYGVSELEQLVTVVTNIFNAMTHNAQFFKNGAAVKGLINIKRSGLGGGVDTGQLEAFKRAWHAMVNGSANAWKTPITQSEGIEFVNMGSTNREMEFTQYLDFLVKIACAVYSIDPGEINFYMNSGGGGASPMFESNQEAKLKMSKDKGLRPLLASLARWINEGIVAAIAPDYRFVWVGIDSKDQKEIIDIRTKEVGSYLTVDEAREEAGRDPMGEENGGNIILNPQYMQYLQQKSMAAQMAAGGGDQPGQEGGGEGEGDENATEQDKGADQGGNDAIGAILGAGGKDEDQIKKSLVNAKEKYLRIMING